MISQIFIIKNICIMSLSIFRFLRSKLFIWISFYFDLLMYALSINKIFISRKCSKCCRVSSYQKQMNYLIRRKTNWEMRRSIVLAPEMSPTQDCVALLLGVVLVWIICKRKGKQPYLQFQWRGHHNSKLTLARYVLVYTLELFCKHYVWFYLN